jgi:ABC-type glycerol-3-phosphate transport system substrate-binding protein
VAPPWSNAWFHPMVWGNGGDIITTDGTKSALTQPPATGAYEFFNAIRKFSPGPEDAKTGTVESGKLAMWSQWDIWYLLSNGKVPYQYQMVPLPKSPKAATHVSTANGGGYGLPKGTKHQDESWELMKFMLSPESLLRIFDASGAPPPRTSMLTKIDIWQSNKRLPDPKVAWEISQENQKGGRIAAKISKWPEMSTAHQEEMTLVWADKAPLDVGVKKVAERWDKLLSESQVDQDTGA